MKKLAISLILVALLAGCTSSTNLGKCISINDKEQPGLVYKYNLWNIFLGFIFSETLIVPLVVVFGDYLKCPQEKSAIPESDATNKQINR